MPDLPCLHTNCLCWRRKLPDGAVQPDSEETEGSRFIFANDSVKNRESRFDKNGITTAKYTWWNFIPKSIFEQFLRFANVYFAFIIIIEAVTPSPVTYITLLMTLIFVLTATSIKEGVEDYRRHQMDKEINNRPVHVVRDSRIVEVQWDELAVGDIVYLEANSHFPADLILLSSSEPNGVCYVETANLDGETNLKIRESLSATNTALRTHADVSAFRATIESEQPNNRLYNYSGTMQIGTETHPLGPKQVLLRGCQLRNSAWVYGITIFTGHETKLMKNTTEAPSKRSSLEKAMNKQIVKVFASLLIFSLISAIIAVAESDNKLDRAWYLPDLGDNGYVFGMSLLIFVILYSSLIPISLYVSVEMVRVIIAQFINADKQMHDETTDTPAKARTSSLGEELGQVSYVFSDKTGTLTRNVMEFFKCSVAGECYGSGLTEIGKAALRRTGRAVEGEDDSKRKEMNFEKGFNMYEPKLLNGAWRAQPKADAIRRFFTFLAVCHTVIPEPDKKNPGKLIYQAASPDEGALVGGARGVGFTFHTRTPRAVVFSVDGEGDQTYEVLNVLEFNSTRKRMSVVVRCPDGKVRLMTKGADSVILPRLAKTSEYVDTTRQHLNQFADEGLRTLVLAEREVSEEEYKEWNHIHYTASVALQNRDDLLDEAAEIIEKDLELVGATAIEDKLQEGVPECISQLLKAGIRVVVLTGDKQETAINIGFACSLLYKDMDLKIVNASTAQDTSRQIEEALTSASESDQSVGLVIDGGSLHFALEDDLKMRFLKLIQACTSVVCCRVSPLQKALVVKLVKDNVDVVTLAIGDGANDVPMIQSAQVGVGISGQEGMQAVMSSDYAIAQFRFLERLLLVHGRYNYQRVANIILYTFWKNIAFVLQQFWFNIFTSFAGATLHDSWHIALYGVAFTSLPVMSVAIFHKDIDEPYVTKIPSLYGTGIRSELFNSKVFAVWLLEGVFYSVILFFIPTYAWGDMLTDGRAGGGVYIVGTMIFIITVVVVNLRLVLQAVYFTKPIVWVILLTILAVFLFNVGYSSASPELLSTFGARASMYQITQIVLSEPNFWLITALCCVICLLPVFVFQAAKRMLRPEPWQIVQESQVLSKSMSGSSLSLMGDSKEVEMAAYVPPQSQDQTRPIIQPQIPDIVESSHVGMRGAVRAVMAARRLDSQERSGYAFSQEAGQFPFPTSNPGK